MASCGFFILYFSLFPALSVLAQTIDTTTIQTLPEVATSPLHYPSLMRRLRDPKADDRIQLTQDLEQLIDSEKTRLDTLNVPWSKQHAYISRLKQQLYTVDPDPSLWQRVVAKVIEWFDSDDEPQKNTGAETQPDIKIPEHPSSFSFTSGENIRIEKLNISQSLTSPLSFSPCPRGRCPEGAKGVGEELKKLISVPEVKAMDDQFLPVYEDTTPDGQEVIISSEIKDIAHSLNNNPVDIINFVRNNITYEPYWGAKKGSVGCLNERVCNDTDATSLTIALLRSAGIPARYKKTAAIFTVDQLKNLLGVEETKSAYAAFAFNNVPVFVVSDLLNGQNFIDADFSRETHLAVEWTHVEAFYDYDERGGNVDNTLSMGGIDTTDALRTLLRPYPKKQWIPIDPVIKPYTHTERPILVDQAQFDTQAFWTNYLSYQGPLSPTEKYADDLLNATGQSVSDNRSTKSSPITNFSILPITLPYVTAGIQAEAIAILPETFSTLPDSRRQQIRITLTKEEGNQAVLQRTFFANEINNVPLNLSYTGATDQDKAVIEANGGIHATPVELVDIIPSLETVSARYQGVNDPNNAPTVSIGDTLVLQFEYLVRNAVEQTSQKFSIAGNNEGIFITLSQIPDDPLLDNEDDQNRASKVLLEGNAAIAREYLKEFQKAGQLFKQSMDYEYNTHFARAVVTQNRILSRVNGAPTTFDFSGLSIDAETYLTSYSNRGDYRTHSKDFRLLWGLSGSYYEGQLFKDIANLDAISTVTGLQYAFANPNEYTVHTITQANENQIDNLNLSPNTKANMHTDVQQGNTVITPDRPVEVGAFRGILYISLTPGGSAHYAIGEQPARQGGGVGNGGWTVNQYILTNWNDSEQRPQYAYEYENGPQKFIYKDNPDKNILCSIKVDTYNQIIGGNLAPGWNITQHGKPCMDDNENGPYQFGDHDHRFIIATDGVYFMSQSDNYTYWERNSVIINRFQQRLPNEIISEKNLYPYWGTYAYAGGNPRWDRQEKINQLGVYNPQTQQVYILKNNLAQKYISPTAIAGMYAPKLLGYPTNEEHPAVESFAETKGTYQNFVNGQMYWVDRTWPMSNRVYVMFGRIAEFYNADENMRDGERGSGGKFGFPIADPFFVPDTNELLQKFEWRMVRHLLNNDQIDTVAYDDHDRRMNNKEYASKILEKIEQTEFTDVEAFARIADYLAYITKDTEEFVRDISILLAGTDTVIISQAIRLITKTGGFPNSDYEQQGFSDTGFKFEYNDSHYCPIAEKGLSNQLRHAANALSLGYHHALNWAETFANFVHEYKIRPADTRGAALYVSPLGKKGRSNEDINLTSKVGWLGQSLKLGFISKEEVGQWILDNLAVEGYRNIEKKNRRELKSECEVKRKFRQNEERLLGDNPYRWSYNKDMEWRDGKYVQDYERWNDSRNVMAILINEETGEIIMQY